MPMQQPTHELDADDRMVYREWLRKMVVAYVALVLCCVAVVALGRMTPCGEEFTQIYVD